MTAGYLHAVGVTFLSLQFVCVLYNPRSCLMSILLRATGQNAIQIRKKKKKDAPTRMLDVLIYRALSLIYIITIIIVPLTM